MGKTFQRRELYELVWSQPARAVAAEIGVSDAALAKACRSADIPLPARGYWAKKKVGKRTFQPPLPPRFPGASDIVEIGKRNYYDPGWQAKLLSEPPPPPPMFEEDMASLEARVRKLVGKVACPQTSANTHRLIQVLLDQDDKRGAEFIRTKSSWYQPKFDAPVEKRRLRILNAIFLAAVRLGCKPSMTTSQYGREEDRTISIDVGASSISIKIAPIATKAKAKSKGNLKEMLR